jgi:hypothetical protein
METVRSFGFLRRSAFRKAFPIICAVATMIAIGAAGYFYLVPHVVAGTTVEPTSDRQDQDLDAHPLAFQTETLPKSR